MDQVNSMNRVGDALKYGASQLRQMNVDSPVLTAEIFLSGVLGININRLFLSYDDHLDRSKKDLYDSYISRRLKGEPVAYITGKQGFWDFEVDVNPNVLIPRSDTECIVEEVLKMLAASSKKKHDVLELGTGSGIITIALAREYPLNSHVASDISLNALALAKKNCMKWCSDSSVLFFCGNLLEPVSSITGKFDIIVSNPPYIPTADIESLQQEIKNFEPYKALDGSSDGLSCIGQIVKTAWAHLNEAGVLFLETGFDQREQVGMLAAESGKYDKIEFFNDYAGNHRVVKMIKKDCSI